MTSDTTIEASSNTVKPVKRRFVFLYVTLGIVMAVLVGRSFFLQIMRGSRFLGLAEGNRVSITSLTAPRGILYDRYDTQLVENVASTDAVFDPLSLPSEEEEGLLIERLPTYLKSSVEDIRRALATTRRTQRVTIVAKALDHETVLALEEAQPTLPGLRLTSSLVRKYLYSDAAAHVIGYTGPVTSEELAGNDGLLPTDIAGKTGIEKVYDQELHGTPGAAYLEVNAEGRTQKELGQQPPVAGTALKLALDMELQAHIHQLFADQAQQHNQDHTTPVRGAVVALDPNTGAIRALVSYPSFDPNLFSQPALKGRTADIFQSPLQPLFNRSSDGEYPPGSTIKPLLALSALEEDIITRQTTVNSIGKITVGPWEFLDWKAGGHGSTDLNKAIAESVNTFFYLLSGGDEAHEGLGVERIKTYLEKFGWGAPTGIDLPGEAAGFVPSPAWKEKVKNESWYIGDTYHLGIGQGDVLATPLQLTTSIAAIANGGLWHQPFIVESKTPPQRSTIPTSPQSRSLPVQPAYVHQVAEAMRHTVTDGSGRALANLDIALAGKTGTAQIGGVNETHAWFTSFGPFERPELVLTVLLEQGGEGDKDAVPFAKSIWQWWIEHRYP